MKNEIKKRSLKMVRFKWIKPYLMKIEENPVTNLLVIKNFNFFNS